MLIVLYTIVVLNIEHNKFNERMIINGGMQNKKFV